MTHKPNPGGKGPKVTKQSGNKGPIIGKMTCGHRHDQAVGASDGHEQGAQERGQQRQEVLMSMIG